MEQALQDALWRVPGDHPLAQPRPESKLHPHEDPAHILQALRAAPRHPTTIGQQSRESGTEEQRRAGTHARLVAEAARSGRILDPGKLAEALNNAETTEAAGEHVVFFNDADDRFYKLTRPGQYGMQADDAEAYLQRWALANHPLGFGDDVRFEGMVLLAGESEYRAVISQPARLAADPSKPNATVSQVEDYLRARGNFYFALYWVHPILGLQVWDFNSANNSNSILTSSGVVPFDLQIEPAPRDFLFRVRAAF